MFSRSIFRAAAPIKQSAPQCFRSYATQPPSSGGGLGPVGYGAIAAVVGGGGYYYYANVQGKAPPIPNVPAPTTTSPAPKAFLGGEQGFLSLKLEKTEDVNHNTKKLVFALPEPDQVSGLPVASALLTKFTPEGAEKPVMRPYTPTSDEEEKGFIELVIKKYPNGAMSEHIHSLKPGQTLDIKGPLPKYPVTPNKHTHIAMIAGGTGLTPMYQVLRAILKNPEDKTKVTLVLGNLTEDDILLKKELEDFENTYPQRFRVFHTLDSPPENWPAGKGHITKDLLKTVLPEPKESNIKVFVCGPPGMYKAVAGAKKSASDQGELEGILKELGYSKDQVFKF